MAVFRVERTRDYTVMSNYHLKDTGLTLKAKGLLSMMLSLPDEWNYTTRGLASICKESVETIGKTLRELESAGYLTRRQLRGKNGRITDTEYTIFEKPVKPQPEPAPPDTASPGTENPDNRVALDDYLDVVGAVQSAEDEFFSELLNADAQVKEEILKEKKITALKNCVTPIQYRRLWLHFVERKSITEIAEAEGISKASISRSLAGALKKISKKFCVKS